MSLFIDLIEKILNEKYRVKKLNVFDPLYCYCNHLKYVSSNNPIETRNKMIIRSKMQDLYNTLNKRFFMNDILYDCLLDEICNIQKTYNAFSKLLSIYKFKKAKTVITVDLYMTEINPQMANVFVVYQNDVKYYFTIRDLINIINKNLSNNDFFFPNPLRIKNPYNNIVFTDCILYNIYFAIKESNYMMPELFQGFFKCNFLLRLFGIMYENNIRNISIRNYTYNSHFDILYPHVITMCEYYNRTLYKNIHDDFPKEKLVKIMRPYLYLFFLVNYGLEFTLNVDYSDHVLKYKLSMFVRYNKAFGRKFIKNKMVFGKKQVEVSFNDNHLNFSEL